MVGVVVPVVAAMYRVSVYKTRHIPRTHYVFRTSFNQWTILLSQFHKFQDYRYEPYLENSRGKVRRPPVGTRSHFKEEVPYQEANIVVVHY